MLRLMLPALCALAILPGVARAAEDNSYLLNAGDKVEVSIWGEPAEKIERVDVLPNGYITLKLAGPVKVKGLDTAQAEKIITEKLTKYYPDPVVSVVVTEAKGNVVYVQGKVIKPGKVQMNGETDVLQALSEAGGLDKFADKDEIKLLRREGKKQKVLLVNYDDLIAGRDMSTNFELQAGDTLVVP
ncbi:sugar ABC transporter substrate-binding protein [Pseudomonas umsongensis]|mgnify:FL=1|jgi:polysaccharide export outer membrane protein|uniref:Sugar ABC transporter substrate-binding protein n=1 Tax=Pseudomonas umsongensis TaxID=198618 RepID=A0AAE6ZVP9_9PSED|nr:MULTISPECIES: polysaccharide biosynthesis/export family protein [Pseudomonas]EPA96067.1 periplasmic protein involved in polysaccharide export [Pseudomonas sp. G5(2012)]MBT9574750.1 polysaccharide biosynthesis/export family protein [Pseudomonas umsongensis]OXR34634.1 sugar ABC transporter substrate-binding protein [Pseudomonas umsongensis]QFG29675.1 sugar ABC transporter substrate-binding protein [Pseudomonas umsongensis]QJC79174.1 sugar ABC transporter substrate-binding protein [Pseudomonas